MDIPNSVMQELTDYVRDMIADEGITEDNIDDGLHIAFNENYYIVGYYNCEQWLAKHDISAWEAIEMVLEYEKDNYGEVLTTEINAERIVNLFVLICGEQIDYHALLEEKNEVV